jgi:hypothetical protein
MDDLTPAQLLAEMDARLARLDAYLEELDAWLAASTEAMRRSTEALARAGELLAETARQATTMHEDTMHGWAAIHARPGLFGERPAPPGTLLRDRPDEGRTL